MPYVGYDERFRVLEPDQRVAMTQFPPLYPTLVAVTRWSGMDALSGARALSALMFAVTGAVGTALVGARTRGVWPMLVTGALLFTADVLIVFSMVWSETVMMAAFVAAILFAVRYFEQGKNRDLLAAGACSIVASGARFVGLAAALAVVIGILVSSRAPLLKRAGHAAAFGGLCLLPTAAWFLRNVSILGAPSEKKLGWYLPGSQHVLQALSTFGGWVVPWKMAMPYVGVVLCLGVVAALLARFRRRAPVPNTPTRVCVWFGFSYLGFVILSRTALDQNIAFDFRILSPLYVVVVLMLCTNIERRGPVAASAVVVIAIAAIVRGATTVPSFSSLSVAAYTGDAWRNSPTLQHAGSLPSQTYLITNAPDPIWIWHDRVSQIIPPRSSLYSGEQNERYVRDVTAIRSATECRKGVVVFFDQPTRKPRRYIEPLLVRVLDLEKTHRFADGEIYEVGNSPCPGGAR